MRTKRKRKVWKVSPSTVKGKRKITLMLLVFHMKKGWYTNRVVSTVYVRF